MSEPDDQGDERAIALLRQGPPGEAAARRELRRLIDQLDDTSRRLLRSDPDLARALWLLDLATMKDRRIERIRAKKWRLRCTIAVSILLLILGLSLFLGTTVIAGWWANPIERALPSTLDFPAAWRPHPNQDADDLSAPS
ncbi:hypothetical protein [Sphingomonas oryzagri]